MSFSSCEATAHGWTKRSWSVRLRRSRRKENPSCSTHLTLHVCDLVGRERILVEGDLGRLEEPEEAQLGREQEQERLALLAGTSRTTDAVDVVTGVIGRVELDDPVDAGNVESSSGDVGTEEDALLRVAELEEGVCPLLLFLLALSGRE